MIKVLVLDQSSLLGSVVKAVIKNEPDMVFAGQARTAAAALAQAPYCNVILAHPQLPQNGTASLLGEIAARYSHVKVLIIDLPRSEPETIVRYIEGGAAGYVLREDSAEELLRKIRAVYDDRPLIDPKVAAALMARIAELAGDNHQAAFERPGLLELTEREREVLWLIGCNCTNREIAERLVIQIGTVKNHVHNILKKLDVHSRRDAAAYLPVLRQQEGVYAGPHNM